MPDAEMIGAQRWHAVVDDMSALGSWCVMNVPKTPTSADPGAGDIQIARCLTRVEAEHLVSLHNASLAGQPPGRHRVQRGDVLIFEQLGETLIRAEQLLDQARQTPAGYPLTEIRHHRAVLSEVLAALSLLAEGAVRLRSAEEGRWAA